MNMIVPRYALQRLRERVAAFRVVIVNGPRQAGKTTLLNVFHDDHGGSFRSLDDSTTLMVAREDPTEFARYGAAPRIIDEIQRGGDDLVLAIEVKATSTVRPEDFRHLRWLADRLGDRFAGGYVLHLGSQTHPFGDRMMALPLSAMWHHAR
jgi:predicted AAA+ superfamily ATPase